MAISGRVGKSFNDLLRVRLPGPTIPNLPQLPAPRTRPSRAPFQSTQRTTREMQAKMSAAAKPIRVLYGHCQIGPEIIYIGEKQATSSWVFQFRWGWGEINRIIKIRLDNQDLPASAIVTNYLGTTTQTVDPTLAALIPLYTDTLVATIGEKQKGIAYSVVEIPSRDMPDSLDFTGELEGLLVNDGGGKVYSVSPPLQMADFVTDDIYGAGWAINDASVQAQKSICAELLTGEARAESHFVIERPAPIADHLAMFAEASLSFVVPDLVNGGIKLVPNRPASAVETFDLTVVAIKGTVNAQPTNRRNVPNHVRVHYTDTSIQPWGEEFAEEVSFKVTNGSEMPRITDIQAPYIHGHRIAKRMAYQIMHGSTKPRLEVDWLHVDDGVRLERGDVHTLTNILGILADGPFRITRRNLERHGSGYFYRIYALDYQSSEFTNQSIFKGPPPISVVDNPTKPPRPDALTLTEIPWLDSGGTYQTKIKMEWTGVAHAQIRSYRVTVHQATGGQPLNNFNVYHTRAGATHDTNSDSVKAGTGYTCSVYSISNTGQTSAARTAVITPTGDVLGPPPGVGPLTVSERLWVDQMGASVSDLQISWMGINDPWIASYRVRVREGATVIWEQPITHLGFVTHTAEVKSVESGVVQTIAVWAVNVERDVSTTASSTTFTPQGRTAKPADVTNLEATEYSEFVELEWDNILGKGDTAHRIRRGDQNSDWDTANDVNRTEYMNPSARAEPRVIWRDYDVEAAPVRYFVKAVAFEGLESNTAIQIDMTITEGKGSRGLDRPRIPTFIEPFDPFHNNFAMRGRLFQEYMCINSVSLTESDEWQTILHVTGKSGFISRYAIGVLTASYTSGTMQLGGRVTIDGRTIWEGFSELSIPGTYENISFCPIGNIGISTELSEQYLFDLSEDYMPFNNELKLEMFVNKNGEITIDTAAGWNHQIT